MSDLLNQIRSMSPEEKAELAAALKDLEPKPKSESREIGQAMGDPRKQDAYGNPLSAEEIWDRENPLQRIPYGYSETTHVFGQAPKTRYWTKAEVDADNDKVEAEWLARKQKVFPSATEVPPREK